MRVSESGGASASSTHRALADLTGSASEAGELGYPGWQTERCEDQGLWEIIGEYRVVERRADSCQQCLNEACNGVSELSDDNEFATRLGASRADGRELLASLRDLIDRANALPG